MKVKSEDQGTTEPIKKTSPSAKSKADEQFIYIGPNLPRGRLTQFTVFKGGTPDYLSDLLEQHPQIKDLIVPVASTNDAQSKSQQSGTAEFESYQTLKALRA
jgi:hypothetical protein